MDQDRLIALETLTYLNILNSGLKIQSTSWNCVFLNEERKTVEGLYGMEFIAICLLLQTEKIPDFWEINAKLTDHFVQSIK